ncbi:hypothetical protein [Granulicella sibirica]|uniref:DUF4352 domain-containing protein n=1 Tax=Granulicella sibirica TaxID=2479048 RepID=A0A4Q0T0R8_9BACT|nr:hypothetical protein [Granulicella sibirica]RXH55091.1 hypothetical protein GRAN_4195 [Granulicella sibirica]
MRVFEWLLGGVAGWTAIGVLGTLLALATGDRPRARRSVLWIVGVLVVYVGAVVLTGHFQAQRVLVPGQEECFDRICYAVAGVQSVGEFKGRGGGRLLQVAVRVANRSGEQRAVNGIEAYLMDGSGSKWGRTVGLGGVPLTLRLPAGGQTESQPVFRVEGGDGELSLVLTRGWTGWGWLVIGDTDSLGHKPTALRLR